MKLLGKVCSTGMTDDVIRLNAAISACKQGGQWEQALTMFHKMRDIGMTTHMINLNAVISACEKGGQRVTSLCMPSQNSKRDRK